jgi:hypothetical protein
MDIRHHESPQERNVPDREADFVREKLEVGFAAIERGEVEDWDSASIKAEGRQLLKGNTAGPPSDCDER